MSKIIENFNQSQLKKDLPDVRPGDTVRVQQKIKEERKEKNLPAGKQEKTQVFEGIVIARKHGKGISSMITVRKIIAGVGVERIFPIHSPSIVKIEVLQKGKTRRAKLYYLRTAKGKRARLKKEEFSQAIIEEPKEESVEKPTEEKPTEQTETIEEKSVETEQK